MSESGTIYITLPVGVMPRPPMTQRIPIPDDVWEQMVERGARAICVKDGHMWPDEHDGDKPEPGQYFTRDYNDQFQRTAYRKQATACLRAALGISDE